MADTCFYCTDEAEKLHQVSFMTGQDEREEHLCEECYKEWLQGIKG